MPYARICYAVSVVCNLFFIMYAQFANALILCEWSWPCCAKAKGYRTPKMPTAIENVQICVKNKRNRRNKNQVITTCVRYEIQKWIYKKKKTCPINPNKCCVPIITHARSAMSCGGCSGSCDVASRHGPLPAAACSGGHCRYRRQRPHASSPAAPGSPGRDAFASSP